MSLSVLPRNVWVLSVSQALGLSGVPMLILVASLLSAKISPAESLVTLPIACIVVGTASSSILVAYLMKGLGRKKAGYLGFSFGMLSCFFGFFAARNSSFELLLISCFVMGVSTAFGQQFRFAVLESVSSAKDFGPALSVFMTGGLIAAFLGPEVGAWGRDLIPSEHGFAGSFLLTGGLVVLAALVFTLFQEPEFKAESIEGIDRPLAAILRSRSFLLAALTAALSYVMMSFIMTATPITMREVCGFGLVDTKRVIQGHILAMFMPSIFVGWVLKRFGPSWLMFAGVFAYLAVLFIGLSGQGLPHFWGALLLLGVGWNFLFTSGTALLPAAHSPRERFKAQAANDFTVFGCQALASLSAGWFLFSFGWKVLLLSCIPVVAGALVASFLQFRREREDRG